MHACVQAQRAGLDALLIRQAAAAAGRERQRRERDAELARIQLDCARQHLAACGCSQLQPGSRGNAVLGCDGAQAPGPGVALQYECSCNLVAA